MDTILQDVRYATRMLRKAPLASAVAIVSLAVGIGINTTVFGWMRGILLNPMPGGGGDRLVTIETVAPSGTLIDSSIPITDLRHGDALRRRHRLSKDVRSDSAPRTLRPAERVWAMLVSGNYFDVLGIRPALGRTFEGDEQATPFDAHPVAVLAHSCGRGNCKRPGGISRTIILNRRPYDRCCAGGVRRDDQQSPLRPVCAADRTGVADGSGG